MEQEQLPGYCKVMIQQVRRTDKHIFLRLAELTRAGFQALDWPEGTFPLDQYVQKKFEEHRN